MASRAHVAMATFDRESVALADERLTLTHESQSTKIMGIDQTAQPVALTERIGLRAREIYLARNGQNGSETEDRLQAEREISLLGNEASGLKKETENHEAWFVCPERSSAEKGGAA
jgi:hypothetical protein